MKKKIIIISLTAVLLLAAIFIQHKFHLEVWQLFLVYLVPYLLIGFGTLKEGLEGLLSGEALDENFLMSVATVGAMFIGFLPGAAPQFEEAIFVMLLFQIGEMLEHIAEDKSRASIGELMKLRPDFANLEKEGKVEVVNPEVLKTGDIILVKPGEKIPVDGIVTEGLTSLDTKPLTGESLPKDVSEGAEVMSGCINLSGLIKVRVTKEFGESTASKIIELVENASENKSRSENFITKFARIYTPIVVGLAVLLAVVPSLMFGDFSTWLYRALTFLIVSCPCALVISVPLTFFGGIGLSARNGILIKGSNWIEALSKTRKVVFDKTGTLTKGVFEVSAVHAEKFDEKELLHLAAHVEQFSNHPIAVSLRSAYTFDDDHCEVADIEEIAGKGIKGFINGRMIYAGNEKLMGGLGLEIPVCKETGTMIHIATENEYLGHIHISDTLKNDSKAAVSELKKLGITKTVMLTGDNKEVAAVVAEKLGIDEFHASLLPGDKVKYLEKELSDNEGVTAFVGDGINDAPVLARADIGISMGGLGSDAAIDASDVVLMDDSPSKIPMAVRISRRTMQIAKQNIVFSIAVKIAVLVLATMGLVPMWLAVFADVGVTLLVILNALRIFGFRYVMQLESTGEEYHGCSCCHSHGHSHDEHCECQSHKHS